RAGLLAEYVLEHRDKKLPVLDALRVGGEAIVARKFRAFERAAEDAEQVVVTRRHHDVAVARREGLMRNDLGDTRPHRAPHPPAREVCADLRAHPADRGLE